MYSFTNQYSGSVLHQRIDMINSHPSGTGSYTRYILAVFILLVSALACQYFRYQSAHKYIQHTDTELFGLITAQTSAQDLDTLQQELHRRHVDLNITKLTRFGNGQIREIGVRLNVPKPGHAIETIVGSSVRRSPIPTLGLHCDQSGCQLDFVDERYPNRLIKLADVEGSHSPKNPDTIDRLFSDANTKYGLYKLFFRNDFLESNYFGMRATGIRMTPDYHLDLYPEYRNAVVFLDEKEISLRELHAFKALDLKKVIIMKGSVAESWLGDKRARNGLILLSRLTNISIRDKYAGTKLLEQAYPELFHYH